MRILDVIPIAKGIGKETLSYFTGSEIEPGSVVQVPLRKKTVPALVVRSAEAAELKSAIRESPYALRKIDRMKSSRLLAPAFIAACADAADYFAGFPGAVLAALVPNVFFTNADALRVPDAAAPRDGHAAKEHFVIQSPDDDRFAHYKSIIREEFVKGSSVFFCLPTVQDIKKAAAALSKGIEAYTVILHGLLSKQEIIAAANKALAERHPILIIATAGFLSLPKSGIGTIIIDKEASRSYKQQARPYLDLRTFAEQFAKRIRAKIILGDLALRVETMHRHRTGEFVEIAPLQFRSLSTARETLVDMRRPAASAPNERKKKFAALGDELVEAADRNIAENGHMFVFAARRGLAPSTVCEDCGTVVSCRTCGAHTVLHTAASGNFFLCHSCGERRDARERCAQCGGWRLTALGIGIELVEAELKKRYPEKTILRIDADRTPTHAKALKTAERFYAAPEAILVGTEMALLYLSEKIENAAVASIDAFFSIPDFRIHERVLSVLLRLRLLAEKRLIVQTRDPAQRVFAYALSGNLNDFYRDELADRKAFRYPPFSTLVKISVAGEKNRITDAMEEVRKRLEPREMDIFPAFIPREKGAYALAGIVRMPAGTWPDAAILPALRELPPNFSVNVDPESLL